MNKLEFLHLNVIFHIRKNITEWNEILFFDSLSKLTQLKTLCLDFQNTEIFGFPSAILPFAETIRKLPHLKKISFRDKQGNYKAEFTNLVSALVTKAVNLTELELDFQSGIAITDHIETFIQMIPLMTSVEILTIQNLSIPLPTTFVNFLDALGLCRNLRIINLGGLQATIENQIFIEKIEVIITRKGFESFSCTGPVKVIKKRELKYQSLNRILERNPKFKKFEIVTFNGRVFGHLSKLVEQKWKN